MRKSFIVLISLFFIGAAQPLLAGTVYVPMAGDLVTAEGHIITTQVLFHNTSGQPQSYSAVFIPATSDGTLVDRESPEEFTVTQRATEVRDDLAPAGVFGLLEITTDDEITVTARLVSIAADGEQKIGANVPVINSRSAIAAGGTGVVQGLDRIDGQMVSDFFMLNLSIERSECNVDVRRRDGFRIFEQTVSLPPLSLFPFEDVLSLLGVMNTTDVSVAVSCDTLSHPYGLSRRVDTGEIRFVPPSPKGAASIDLFPTSDCPEDALFQLPGDFHIPSPQNERATFFVDTTPGEVFSRLILTMEFTMGDWNRGDPSGNHAVFWLNRTPQWASNLFGYVNLFGPRKNFAKMQTNVGLPRGVIEAVQQGANFEPGLTYTVRYTYDTEQNFIEAIFTQKGGGEVVRLNDIPTVNRIVTDNNFMLAFGHTSHEEGPEVTTFGWRYSNLCFRLE